MKFMQNPASMLGYTKLSWHACTHANIKLAVENYSLSQAAD